MIYKLNFYSVYFIFFNFNKNGKILTILTDSIKVSSNNTFLRIKKNTFEIISFE